MEAQNQDAFVRAVSLHCNNDLNHIPLFITYLQKKVS
jgi:hypothetical protein